MGPVRLNGFLAVRYDGRERLRRIPMLQFLLRIYVGVLVVAMLGLPAATVNASCVGMAEAPALPHPFFVRASSNGTVNRVPPGQLRITFVGHSTFEIESPGGAIVQTDYNDYVRSPRIPHVVTMNNAHSTHYSYMPEDSILHVLRGWDPEGGMARHNLEFRDLRVRNVPTNLRPIGGGKFTNGNSMFVIEGVGLCVVHISHLHHYLSPEQLRDLGLIDVAFAPIDGMWTMSHDELFRVLTDIRARIIIPMHYGSVMGVDTFIARAKDKWPVRHLESDTMFVSLRTMPKKPEIVFLAGH